MRGRPKGGQLFTAEQVKAWREEYQQWRSLRSADALARDAGISDSSMKRILSRQTYKWVQ